MEVLYTAWSILFCFSFWFLCNIFVPIYSSVLVVVLVYGYGRHMLSGMINSVIYGLNLMLRHLEENLDDWLTEELDNFMEDDYFVFDCPGICNQLIV